MCNPRPITQIYSTFFLLLFASLLQAPLIHAQVEDPSSGELLEHFFETTEQASESDAQQFLENLEYLSQHPLDLNKATETELLETGLLNPLQVHQFIEYRDKLGNLLNIYELQSVPGWQLPDIRRVLPFVKVASNLDQRGQPLYRGLLQGENNMVLRWGRPYPPSYPANSEGGADILAIRFRHRFDKRLSYGFTAEKDAGEAFFAQSNPNGFDFYSFHMFIQNPKPWVSAVALGDYSARLGQGLLLQTGFAAGKSAESLLLARGGQKIKPYSSFGEAFFFRGAATTLSFGDKWDATILYSLRNKDANLLVSIDSSGLEPEEREFTSLQSSGLHRTPSEIADEGMVQEHAAGFSVSRTGARGQIALNGLYLNYNTNFTPTFAPYRQFQFSGRHLGAMSVDYDYHYRNLLLFGETATSDNGGAAFLNGLLLSLDRNTTLAILHRHFDRDYQSVYASAFAEGSKPNNEEGLYLGTEIRPSKPWRINAYVDAWRFPWLRYQVDAPSRGYEYLLRTIWTPKRGVSFYCIWESRNKEQSAVLDSENGLYGLRRDRLRLHAMYKINSAVELRSRVEWTWSRLEGGPVSHGFVAYQEAVVKALGFPVYGSVRFTIYDTDDYNSRVYTYENDLFAALSVPVFSGRGSRYYLNLKWRVNDWMRMEARWEQTLLEKSVTTGSEPGRKGAWKVQAQFSF